jgi:quinol monooxygenase YgiN
MAFQLVRHKVKDFAKWKPFYDQHGAARKAAGCKGARLFRTADNPNELVVLLEWDSVETAQKFAQSQDLRKILEQSGVEGQPEMTFLQEIERTPA